MSADRRLYLDYNATAPVRPEAKRAMTAALEAGGNPSSIHAAGRAARDQVEQARRRVAALIGASTERLVFTSGGTEANVLGLSSLAHGARRLLIGATEHEAVSATAQALAESGGHTLEIWPVDALGRADLDWLDQRLARWTAADGAPVAALMLANNETGVVQPVAEAAARIHAAGGRLHVDAVQAAGKIDLDMAALGADTLALSAHKLGGPQGVGGLAFASGPSIRPLWRGGGQEQALRSGTENVAGIAGFGAAAAACDLALAQAQADWRDAAEEQLLQAGAVVIGRGAPRLPNTLCLAFEGWESSRQVMMLDLDGVCVSAGSACSSGKVKPSSVLTAMGLSALAPFALRASGGWATEAQDWTDFVNLWLAAAARFTSRRQKELA